MPRTSRTSSTSWHAWRKKSAGPAVDLHPAADLVDERQFFVGVGELAGERVDLALEAVELHAVADHALEQLGLAEQRFAP